MNFETIPAAKVNQYIGEYNTVIVDLRESYEYEAGHIPTSVNIPFEEFLDRKSELVGYDNILLYCDRGGVSMLAARELDKIGYRAINMYGGIHSYRGELTVEEIHSKEIKEFFIDCTRKVI